jgi:F-type H+-transporting ATPase subunit b
MPQFDLANFVPQLAWLTLFFTILYFGIVRLTLPKIGGLVDRREATVKSDIVGAESAKAESDRVRETYEAAIASAHSSAQATVGSAKAAAARATETRLAEANQSIEAHLAEAQASLDAARGGAMAEVERIAAEAAVEIVTLVSGRRPDEAAALAAVRRSGAMA